jgi:hypothetical protein
MNEFLVLDNFRCLYMIISINARLFLINIIVFNKLKQLF